MTELTQADTSQNAPANRMRWILLLLFAVQFGLIFPLLSWAGFPPIDEGFQLAYSRRILNGEVPHRDFISIRPVLTPILHTLDLLLSENYTFRVSRAIVLLEYVLIAYFGIRIVAKHQAFSFAEYALISTIGLLLVMDYGFFGFVWYTVDGLLLSVAGLLMIQSERRLTNLAGFFLLGLSPLAKQNFAVVPVAAILMTKPGKRLESVVAMGLGPALYLAAMWWFGAIGEFMAQIASQSQVSYLLRTGCRPSTAVASLVIGAIAAQISLKPLFNQRVQEAVIFLIAFVFLTIPLAYGQISASKTWVAFYFLFGWFLRATPGRYGLSLVNVIVPMTLAWTSSISFFHSTVAYFGIWLFATGCHVVFYKPVGSRSLRYPFVIGSLLTIGLTFIYIRTNIHTITFKEPPVFQVDRSLNGIVPGAAGIYTSAENEAIYRDIASAASLLKAQRLDSIVLPDLPAWNVMNKKKNPVAMDWPYFMELGNQALRTRYARSVVDCKTTHGLVFFSEPFLDKKGFPGHADAHNSMWNEILREYPIETKVGRVRVYTLRPLEKNVR